MKSLASALFLVLLAGCGSRNDDPQSEAMIANAAVQLEKQADANVNRMIAEIEANSDRTAETAPVAATEDTEPEDKAGIEKQGDDDT